MKNSVGDSRISGRAERCARPTGTGENSHVESVPDHLDFFSAGEEDRSELVAPRAVLFAPPHGIHYLGRIASKRTKTYRFKKGRMIRDILSARLMRFIHTGIGLAATF
jgi:hypothetical protein